MHLIGVDLGRVVDAAAVVIFEDELVQKPVTKAPLDVPPRYLDVPSLLVRRYNLVDMIQWRGVTYPEIARKIGLIMKMPEVSHDIILAVDATAVGQAVMDMLRADPQLDPIGVTFTSGKSVTQSTFGYNVPKRDLVVNLQVMFQMERIRIAEEHPLALEFKEQLRHYTSNIDKVTLNESFDGEGGVHDDLPMAAAVIMWYCEHVLASELELPSGDNGSRKAFNPATYGLS
jgi:hypothetical protein